MSEGPWIMFPDQPAVMSQCRTLPRDIGSMFLLSRPRHIHPSSTSSFYSLSLFMSSFAALRTMRCLSMGEGSRRRHLSLLFF